MLFVPSCFPRLRGWLRHPPFFPDFHLSQTSALLLQHLRLAGIQHVDNMLALTTHLANDAIPTGHVLSKLFSTAMAITSTPNRDHERLRHTSSQSNSHTVAAPSVGTAALVHSPSLSRRICHGPYKPLLFPSSPSSFRQRPHHQTPRRIRKIHQASAAHDHSIEI